MPEIYRNVLELVMRRGKLLHIVLVYVLLIAPARIEDGSDSSQRKVRFALMTSSFFPGTFFFAGIMLLLLLPRALRIGLELF